MIGRFLRWLTNRYAPSSDYWYGPRGAATSSGIEVSPDVAQTLSTVFACQRILSGTGASLPLNLMEKVGGTKRVAEDHPVHRLIHTSPNREHTSMTFRCYGLSQQVNLGDSFSEIERDMTRRPVALWPIHHSRVEMYRAGAEFAATYDVLPGSIVWKVRNDGAIPTWIPDRDMLHVRSIILCDDGIRGKGVITNARETIGHGLATIRQGAAYMKNSARPAIAIEGGRFQKNEDREFFRSTWMAVHGGAENNGLPALVPEGAKITPISFNPEDSQFLGTLQHNVEDICRWFGVPPHMVQHLLRATFNNIEHLGIDFVVYSLILWLKIWEEEIGRKLLTPEEQATLYAKHNVEGLLRGDSASRAAFYKAMWELGVFSINEIREKEDMNPIGPDGDKHFVQTSYTTVERLAAPPEVASEEDGVSETDEVRSRMETYGIGVRSGSVTPQIDDEEHFRQLVGLPAMSADVRQQWVEDNGTRRPVTLLTDGAKPAPQQPDQDAAEPPPDEDAEPRDMSATLAALAEFMKPSETIATREAAIRDSAKIMVQDAYHRVISRETTALSRASTKEPKEFFKWVDEFYDEHQPIVADALRRPVQAYFTACGQFTDVETVVSDLAYEHVRESRETVLKQTELQPSEWGTLPERFRALTDSWKKTRVDKCLTVLTTK